MRLYLFIQAEQLQAEIVPWKSNFDLWLFPVYVFFFHLEQYNTELLLYFHICSWDPHTAAHCRSLAII